MKKPQGATPLTQTVIVRFVGLLLAAILGVSLAIVNFRSSDVKVAAQEQDNTLQELLNRLNAEVLQYSTITITFVHTAMGEFDEFVVGLEGPPRNTVTEIGNDYVCFSSDTGGVEYIFCTPYSNIASIDYVAQR
jgi:hypothetical protein